MRYEIASRVLSSSTMSSTLRTLHFVTITDALYAFPDMMDIHIEELKVNLDRPTEKIVVRNLSEAVLVLPYRILSRVEIESEQLSRDNNVIWRREV